MTTHNFRPQNSRHEDPVQQERAVQYIANPMCTWYVLREKYPEQYEAAVDLPPDEWFHVKVVVSGAKAEVFVNDDDTPCLTVGDLKHGLSRGSVGLWAGNTSGDTFANLKVKPMPMDASADEKIQKKVQYTPEQTSLFKVFESRRSVRKFKSDPIPQEHILKMIDIARTAPTSGNQQPWKFLIIQDRDKILQLKKESLNSYAQRLKQRGDIPADQMESGLKSMEERIGGYLSTPVFILVLTDKNSRYPSYNVYDGPLAAGYLCIAARVLGYGTVYTTDSFPTPLLKKVFEIPDNFERVCFMPVGVPETWPNSPEKKRLDEFLAYEKLIEGVNYDVPVTRKAITLAEDILNIYIGTYEFEEGLRLTVTLENGQIFAQVTGQPKIEIFPEAEDRFFLKVADVQIAFLKSGQNVTGLILHQAGRELKAKKIEESMH